MSLPGWSKIEEKFWGMQDMNTHLLSATLDFDSCILHVPCCVSEGCLDSGEFHFDRVVPVLVGTSFSRLVWCSERFTLLTVVMSTLAFFGPSAVWSTALEFRARYFFFWILRKLSYLVYLREHLNDPENLCTFVSPFLVLVTVSVWNDTEKISISLRRC